MLRLASWYSSGDFTPWISDTVVLPQDKRLPAVVKQIERQAKTESTFKTQVTNPFSAFSIMSASNHFSYAHRNDGQHHHRRHHHYSHFPPREYTDLSNDDISLIAACLAPMPAALKTSAGAAYEKVIKQRIEELPPHLKNKIPFLAAASLCKMHRGMNALVVVDLLNFIGKEASASSDVRLQRVRNIADGKEEKCAACKLSMIGRNVESLILLGASLLSQMKEKHWSKSKRIVFLEAWIGECCEWRREKEELVERMWELGVEMKRSSLPSRPDERKERVRRFVDKAREGPERPLRSPEQDDHVAFVVRNCEFLDMGNPFADDRGDERGDERAPTNFSRRSLVPAPLELAGERKRSSSVYSTDGFWESARELTESRWIGMYLDDEEGARERGMF